MNTVPACLLTEFAQPANEVEEARVQAHSAQFRAIHREWSAKILSCPQVGILSRKSNLMNGMDWGAEIAYVDADSDNLALFRHWGMTFNDICAIEEALELMDPNMTYLALATERRLDSGLSHFTLFAIDHKTGDQALVFHRSGCDVEGFAPRPSRTLR
ncbi:MAG: hypothetical protein P4L46_19430 [Fimbriimonas sp.]|nr:hypothetical protein [Fimbriimonas sp.]